MPIDRISTAGWEIFRNPVIKQPPLLPTLHKELITRRCRGQNSYGPLNGMKDSTAQPENVEPVPGCPVYPQERGMEDAQFERPLTRGRVSGPAIVRYLKIWKCAQLQEVSF